METGHNERFKQVAVVHARMVSDVIARVTLNVTLNLRPSILLLLL